MSPHKAPLRLLNCDRGSAQRNLAAVNASPLSLLKLPVFTNCSHSGGSLLPQRPTASSTIETIMAPALSITVLSLLLIAAQLHHHVGQAQYANANWFLFSVNTSGPGNASFPQVSAASSPQLPVTLTLVHTTDIVQSTGSLASFWVGNISVGTPAQNFTVIFDTGSPNFWLNSSPCQSGMTPATSTAPSSGYNCSSRPSYNHGASSTYTKDGTTYSASYGAGTVQGFYSHDTVTIGNGTNGMLSLANAPFVEANNYNVRSHGQLFTETYHPLGSVSRDRQLLFPGLGTPTLPLASLSVQTHCVNVDSDLVLCLHRV
jgi:Eukaryotic aspartyl protease